MGLWQHDSPIGAYLSSDLIISWILWIHLLRRLSKSISLDLVLNSFMPFFALTASLLRPTFGLFCFCVYLFLVYGDMIFVTRQRTSRKCREHHQNMYLAFLALAKLSDKGQTRSPVAVGRTFSSFDNSRNLLNIFW